MTLVHPQLVLVTPPVPSVSHSTHMYTSCSLVLLYTGIVDLFKVQLFLKKVVNWKDLGLALGLIYPILQKIEKEQHKEIDECMREMLAAWLQLQDNVSQHGVPSWTALQTALRMIGENELANDIST